MRGNRRDRDPSDTADQLSAAAVAAGGHVPPPVQANFLLCVLRVVRRYACFHMRHMYLICSRVLPWPCPEHEENIVMEVSCTVCDFEACQNILQRTSAAMLACNSPEKLARGQDFHLPRFQAVVHRVSTISGFSADS